MEIKKYPNRRYYDATQSRHLTLDEIRSHVQQGYDLRVIDAKSGVDITAQVLMQIILELDTAKLDSMPVPLLVRIIRMNDQLVKDFLEKYFNQALQSFLDYQRQVEEQIRRTHGLPTVFPTVSDWTKAMLGPFAAGLDARPAEPAAPMPTPAGAQLENTVKQLQEQVAALQQQAQRRAPRRGARAKGGAPETGGKEGAGK